MQEKLTYITYVRFTEQEKHSIQKKADEYGMSFSSVVRMYVKRAMKGIKK